MSTNRPRKLREALTLVWLALVASCGRSSLYGDLQGEAGETLQAGGRNSTGGRSGRGGRDGAGDGGSTDSVGGTSNATGGDGPTTGGVTATGGSSVTGGSSSGGSSTAGSPTGGTSFGGAGTGGMSGNAGQSGNAGAGEGGELNTPGVDCSGTICDSTEMCCVGLTATACLPPGTACNGAVLNCAYASECADGEFCCLTMGGGMAVSNCSNDCSNSAGSGRLNLRLCSSNDDCTPNRECRMTFIGVNACMRRP